MDIFVGFNRVALASSTKNLISHNNVSIFVIHWPQGQRISKAVNANNDDSWRYERKLKSVFLPTRLSDSCASCPSFAQFERSMIHKRQAEGIALAKAKGENSPYKGRKASIDRNVITDMLNAGSSVTAIARALNISRQSVYRIKNEVAWAYLYCASLLTEKGTLRIMQ